MPGTLWSAPSSTQSTTSYSVPLSAALIDASPAQLFIGASTLNPGTRIRMHAAGEYTATTTASAITWGFYLSAVGTAISATTSAVLATTASTAVVVVTGGPFILDYSGVVQAVSIPQNATTGKIVGQGTSLLPLTLNSFTGPIPIPTSLAARTVAQTSTITGLNTELNLYASLGVTIVTNTGLTSITVDELTCELIG